jgi:Uncharacterised protein family UPF0102
VSVKRVRAYRRGLFAESIAALLLRLKGHRIIARRYKTPVGEIDLVALKGKRLAFVKVKQRELRRRRLVPAQPSAAAHRQGGAILARRPSGLCRPRACLRRGACRALGLAALYRQCLPRVMPDTARA